MASHRIISMAAMASLLLVLTTIPTGVEAFEVYYGMDGNNLPQPSDMVNLYKSNNIAAMRIYSPDQANLNVAFRYIAVGNEVIPNGQSQSVLPAMNNIQSALSSAGLQNIKVSTSVSTGVLGTSYPPSAGSFSSDASSSLGPIIQFLVSNGSPLLANVYPSATSATSDQSTSPTPSSLPPGQ